MAHGAALKLAIELVHVPTRVRAMRSRALPHDIDALLQVAAGDEEALRKATATTGRTRDDVHKAAVFFIEQILFAPDADSYRVLGVGPGATPGELRRNMALLLRWLHPDLAPQGKQSTFACKVTGAWNDLKTAERRAAYDLVTSCATDTRPQLKTRVPASKERHRVASAARRPAASRPGAPKRARTGEITRVERRGLLRRALDLMLGGAR
jgi:DnaJ-like protein